MPWKKVRVENKKAGDVFIAEINEETGMAILKVSSDIKNAGGIVLPENRMMTLGALKAEYNILE